MFDERNLSTESWVSSEISTEKEGVFLVMSSEMADFLKLIVVSISSKEFLEPEEWNAKKEHQLRH